VYRHPRGRRTFPSRGDPPRADVPGRGPVWAGGRAERHAPWRPCSMRC
jgi:hypothetical protein